MDRPTEIGLPTFYRSSCMFKMILFSTWMMPLEITRITLQASTRLYLMKNKENIGTFKTKSDGSVQFPMKYTSTFIKGQKNGHESWEPALNMFGGYNYMYLYLYTWSTW